MFGSEIYKSDRFDFVKKSIVVADKDRLKYIISLINNVSGHTFPKKKHKIKK